jgi:PAS domain S-box-containing protein
MPYSQLPPLPPLQGMPPPLRWSMPLMLVALGVIGTLIQTVVSLHVIREQMEINTEERCLQQGRHMAKQIVILSRQGGMERVEREMKHLMDDHGFHAAWVLDKEGRIQAGEDQGKMWNPPEEARELFTRVQSRVANRGVSHVKENQLVGMFAHPKDDPTLWSLVMVIDNDPNFQDAWKVMMRSSIIYMVISLGLCLLAWLGMRRLVSKRLRAVMARAEALAERKDIGPTMQGRDEFAQIDRALLRTHYLLSQKEQILLESEERYRSMLEAMPAPVVVVRQGLVEYANAVLLQTLGYSNLDELVGWDPLQLVSKKDRPLIRQLLEKLINGACAQPAMELELLRKDGSALAVMGVSSSFRDSRGKALQVVLQDITDRKEAEAHQEKLARVIAEVAEAEKRRIGQDLHDDICQRLAALKISMQDMEEEIAEKAPSLMMHADVIVGRLDEAISTTRGLARGLSPVEIESGGLAIALEALCRTSSSVHGISCILKADLDVSHLSMKTATQLYRIAQECITNAARHGKSTEVRITLEEKNKALHMTVANDGLPFSPTSAPDQQGMGLHIMRHRAASIGAQLLFHTSATDHEVEVVCITPQPSTEATTADET